MDDDMILPDDFTETPSEEAPEAEPTQDEMPADTGNDEVESEVEDTKPIEEQAAQEPVTQTLKVKYNSEEREIPLDEAIQLAQKGMNYEKAIERAKQEAAQQARDAYIAEQRLVTWDGRPINTEAEYKLAQMEQDIVDRYQGHVPEELLQELVESRRDREERQKEKAAAAEQSRRDADFNAFFDYFKDANGREFDANKDAIPNEVRTAVENGQSLKYAYMEYHNKELINRLKISETNKANQRKAPIGSVTAGGGIKTDPNDLFLEGFDSI